MAAPPLPPWLSNTTNPTPLLTLTLSPSTTQKEAPLFPAKLAECCRELEQGHQAWLSHKKETAWRFRRVELQLESEKASRRREKVEEIEAKVKALREEQAAAMDRIDAEYKEQILALRREAEAKDQKLVEQLAAKHARIGRLVQQLGCCRR